MNQAARANPAPFVSLVIEQPVSVQVHVSLGVAVSILKSPSSVDICSPYMRLTSLFRYEV